MANRIKGITVESGGDTTKLQTALKGVNGDISKEQYEALQKIYATGTKFQKGSQAGTSLRTVLANMAKPSNTVAAAMDELGISVTNSDGSFKSLDEMVNLMRTSFSGLTDDQKAYYATALAGKEGMSGLLSLLNLSQSEYDKLSESMNNCSGIAGQTASVMQDNLQSKIEQLGGALESLAIKLSEYIIPFLTGLVEKISAAVDAFTNMNPAVQKAVLVVGGIIAVAGPLLIIAAIAVWNAIKAFFVAVWEGIKNIFTTVVTAISTFLGAAWNTIQTVVTTVFTAIQTFFTTVWNTITTTVTTAVTAIQTFLTAAWNTIKTVITTVLTAIQTVFTTIWNAIKTIITTVVNGIKNTITTVLR